jgi:hypothetical protein
MAQVQIQDSKLTSEQIFENLTRYYVNQHWECDENHNGCSAFVKDGEYRHPIKNNFKVGKENDMGGLLLICNGDKITKQMIDDSIINTQDIKKIYPAKTSEEFELNLKKYSDDDGAIVYDGVKKEFKKVGILQSRRNTKEAPEFSRADLNLESILPRNFNYDNADSIDKNGRTEAAIRASTAYPHVEVYLIRESAYTKLGPGILAHFKDGKLIETYHLMPLTETKEYKEGLPVPVIDKKHGVVGCYRRYINEEGNTNKINDEIRPAYQIITDANLKDINKSSVYQKRKKETPALELNELIPA